MVGAPKDFHWSFHLTVPLAAPHVSLLVHILILYLSPKQIPGGNHPVSSHELPYFGIHYLYPATLSRITCLNSNATAIVIFLLFDFLFSYPLSSPHLEWPVKALWLVTTHNKNTIKNTLMKVESNMNSSTETVSNFQTQIKTSCNKPQVKTCYNLFYKMYKPGLGEIIQGHTLWKQNRAISLEPSIPKMLQVGSLQPPGHDIGKKFNNLSK